MHLIEFNRCDDDPFFRGVEDRKRILMVLDRLSKRMELRLHGWRVSDRRLVTLVHGDVARLAQWRRLVQSAYGVNNYYWHRPPVYWRPASQVPIDDIDFALGVLYAGRSPWSSVWETLGLRDWGVLPADLGIPHERHARRAGLTWTPQPYPGDLNLHGLGVLSRAILMTTGTSSSARANSIAFAQLAKRCGWDPLGVSLARGLSTSSIKKALRKKRRPTVDRAATWMRPPLRRLLDEALPTGHSAGR